jgi:peptidoglycan/LPS O-acetylase OafA/YrhL
MESNTSSATPTSFVKPKSYFYFIDALRGIAALWVFFFHAALDGRLTTLTNILPHWFVVVLFEWGGLGVPIFFVISGFVIAHTVSGVKVDFAYLKYFSLRRFLRLTPPYYFSIIVALAFALLASNVKGEIFSPGNDTFSLPRLLAHLFYLQELFRLTNFNDVYWTLCLEVQFYLCFCVLLGLAQWLKDTYNFQYSRAFIFAPVAILSSIFSIIIFLSNSRPNFFLPFFYQFLLGIFAYWSWQDKLKSIYFYIYCGLVLVFQISNFPNQVITSIVIAILLLETGKANYIQKWLKWDWLQFIGKISYSLYLTHTPIYGAIFFIASKFLKTGVISELLSLIIGLIVCILFAAFMWQLVEKPSINFSKKIKLQTTSLK